MATSLREMLRRRRLDLDEGPFVEALERQLERTGGPPYGKPSKHLSSHQLEILASGGFDVSPLDHGIDDPAIRGVISYAALILTALSTEEAAKRLDVTQGRIRQRLNERQLYGIKVGKDWRLPLFQFTEHGLVPNIERVLPFVSRGLAPTALVRWLTRPDPDLEIEGRAVSPLEWLLEGSDPEAVAELVEDLR